MERFNLWKLCRLQLLRPVCTFLADGTTLFFFSKYTFERQEAVWIIKKTQEPETKSNRRDRTPEDRFEELAGFDSATQFGMQTPESGFCCSFQILPVTLKFQFFPFSTRKEECHVSLDY